MQDCSAEQSSGDARLDAYTCALILKRGKFKAPARWLDGSPAYGVVRLPVFWAARSPTPPPPFQADLVLTVSKLPDGVRSPAVERLMFAADENGHFVSCESRPPQTYGEPANPANNEQLVQVACGQLIKTYTAIAAKDENGRPVRSIQNASVLFEQ
jgi:hypothetical protein